nr:MAG TPA: hypothetical protein [Caudoviricetes sp.]
MWQLVHNIRFNLSYLPKHSVNLHQLVKVIGVYLCVRQTNFPDYVYYLFLPLACVVHFQSVTHGIVQKCTLVFC